MDPSLFMGSGSSLDFTGGASESEAAVGITNNQTFGSGSTNKLNIGSILVVSAVLVGTYLIYKKVK